MRAILVSSTLSLLLVVAPAALARPLPKVRHVQVQTHHSQPHPYPRAAAAGACQRMCPKDMAPCDPVSFKIVDGRCNPGMREGL